MGFEECLVRFKLYIPDADDNEDYISIRVN